MGMGSFQVNRDGTDPLTPTLHWKSLDELLQLKRQFAFLKTLVCGLQIGSTFSLLGNGSVPI